MVGNRALVLGGDNYGNFPAVTESYGRGGACAAGAMRPRTTAAAAAVDPGDGGALRFSKKRLTLS